MLQKHWLVDVTIDGRSTGRPWDKFSGGEANGTNTKNRPGGSLVEKSHGGSVSYSDITISRELLPGEEDLAKTWMRGVGRMRVSTSRRRLDPSMVPVGRPIVQGGVLTKVQIAEADSSSDSVSMVECTISVDGEVA